MKFSWRRPNDFMGNLAIKSRRQSLREGFLHWPVFAGMEGKDNRPPARLQNQGQLAQQGFEGRQLVIDRDPQRLKHAPDRVVVPVFVFVFVFSFSFGQERR